MDFNNSWKNRSKILTIVGLVFAVIGDYVIIPAGVVYFIVGTASFLVCHVFHIAAATVTPSLTDKKVEIKPLRAIPVAVVFLPPLIALIVQMVIKSISFVYIISVVVYSAISFSSIWRQAARIDYSPVSTTEKIQPQIAAFLGLVLFGISDLILAFDGFTNPLPLGIRDFLVFGTYWVGQALLMFGMMYGANLEGGSDDVELDTKQTDNKAVALSAAVGGDAGRGGDGDEDSLPDYVDVNTNV